MHDRRPVTTLADFAAAVKARVGGPPIGLGGIDRPLDLRAV